MKALFLVLFLLVFSYTQVHAETLFRWKDKEGKVHYGDRPAEGAIDAEAKKFGTPAVDELSYGVGNAARNFPVTLYVAANCGDYCVQARALLNKRGIPFAEKNLLTKEDIDANKVKTGGEGIPALTVGKTALHGFESNQWNTELDLAAYPKIAPYGSRPKQPAAAKPETNKEDSSDKPVEASAQ